MAFLSYITPLYHTFPKMSMVKTYIEIFNHFMYNKNIFNNMVGLAQMVRASDCGPEGRRFDPDIPPQCECSTAVSIQVFQTWDEGSTPSTRTIFYAFT